MLTVVDYTHNSCVKSTLFSYKTQTDGKNYMNQK